MNVSYRRFLFRHWFETNVKSSAGLVRQWKGGKKKRMNGEWEWGVNSETIPITCIGVTMCEWHLHRSSSCFVEMAYSQWARCSTFGFSRGKMQDKWIDRDWMAIDVEWDEIRNSIFLLECTRLISFFFPLLTPSPYVSLLNRNPYRAFAIFLFSRMRNSKVSKGRTLLPMKVISNVSHDAEGGALNDLVLEEIESFRSIFKDRKGRFHLVSERIHSYWRKTRKRIEFLRNPFSFFPYF